MQYNPDDNNHAGDLAPRHSAYYNALTASRMQMVANYKPLQGPPDGPFGTIGIIRPRTPDESPLVGQKSYFGEAPQALQAIIRALPPWLRRS